jgi:hypothetical protein
MRPHAGMQGLSYVLSLRDPEPLFRHLPLQSVSELEALAPQRRWTQPTLLTW